jgi:hypothetical protein
MRFFVITNNKKKVIELDILTKGNKIGVIGHDVDKPNTEYFNRMVVKDGTYTFNLPQSPKVLKVIVLEVNEGDTDESDKYEITGFRYADLPKQALITDQYTSEFIKFAQEFSAMAGYLPPNDYYSDNRNFMIRLLPEIREDPKTPSRIHTETGVIEVSKKWFDGMTVPGRMAILQHEFAHNNLNNSYKNNNETEKEADENALQIYLALGYPKVEWMYAWTHIFEDHESHFDRLDNSNAMLQGL